MLRSDQSGKKLLETPVKLGENVSTLNQVTVVKTGPKMLIKFDVDSMIVTKWLECQQVFGVMFTFHCIFIF